MSDQELMDVAAADQQEVFELSDICAEQAERIALLEEVAAMAIMVSGNTSPLRDDNIELAAALRAAGYLED